MNFAFPPEKKEAGERAESELHTGLRFALDKLTQTRQPNAVTEKPFMSDMETDTHQPYYKIEWSDDELVEVYPVEDDFLILYEKHCKRPDLRFSSGDFTDVEEGVVFMLEHMKGGIPRLDYFVLMGEVQRHAAARSLEIISGYVAKSEDQ